jgi:hypothetical protein
MSPPEVNVKMTKRDVLKKRPPLKGKVFPEYSTPQQGERWRHWKGDIVEVQGISLHSETKESLVRYIHVTPEGSFWVRPLSMWHDSEPKMKGKRRFEKVK